MPASLNKVMLIGNLTRDPELRYIPSGQAVTTFTIAVNRTYNSQSGEKKEEVSFIRVVAWGRTAENCNEYLKKGRTVFVEGRLQSRSWDAPDGSKRSTMEVVAQSVQFLFKAPPSEMPSVDNAIDINNTLLEGSADSPAQKKSITVSESELRPDEDIPF
jgi:single-strand DNA-binding protein